MYLTPERLEHVLRRHHTGVWDGTFGAYDMQTFFPNGTSYSQIVDWMSKCLKYKELVKEVLLKRNTLGKNRLTFKVDYNGMRFKIGLKKGPNGELINSIQFINYGGFNHVNDQVLKIDKIELRFKCRDGRIQSIEEFSRQFERGILFFEHPETVNDSVVIMDIVSNYGSHSCYFKFDRMDIDMGHYLIDELVAKWSLIWTWYNQAHFDSNKQLRKYPSIFEMVKSRFGETSKEYEAVLDSSPEEVRMYMDAGEVDEIDDIHKNMDWMIEFDNKNSFEKMRREKIYFEHDFQVWVDLDHSLPAIREIISELEGTEN